MGRVWLLSRWEDAGRHQQGPRPLQADAGRPRTATSKWILLSPSDSTIFSRRKVMSSKIASPPQAWMKEGGKPSNDLGSVL